MESIAVNAQAEALSELCDDGYLRIKSATGVILAEFKLDNPAFSPAIDGVITARTVGAEMNAPFTGVAARYEVFEDDGETLLWTGEVGISGTGSDLELSDINIVAGSEIHIASFTHTVPRE
jgi:hypothetical protein